MEAPPGSNGFHSFVLVWSGQVLSLIGSSISRFALGVWVYQQTGAIADYASVGLYGLVPYLLLMPVAGVVVDRYPRRAMMLASDAGEGLCSLVVMAFFLGGEPSLWVVRLSVAASAVASAFRMPAYSSAMALLVPKRHLGRASGMVEVGQGLSEIVAPAAGGALLTVLGIQGVLLLDILTFLVAVVTLLAVRVPPAPRTREGQEGAQGPLWQQLAFGLRYIVRRPGLAGLTAIFGLLVGLMGLAEVLLPPVLLKLTSAATLGLVLSACGVGALSGSVVMSVWGGPRRKVHGLVGFAALFGLGLGVAGVRPLVELMMVGGFITMFSYPLFIGCHQALWLSKVAPDAQGRVLATRRMLTGSVVPLAFLAAGPLADGLFEPLLQEGGLLAGSVGLVLGVGPGRGIGLLFLCMGGLGLVAAALIRLVRPIWRVESLLADWSAG